MQEILVGIVVVLVVWILNRSRQKHSYWKNKGVPYFQPVPIFGSVWEVLFMRKSFGSLYKDLYWRAKKRGAKYMGFYEMGKPKLIITDAELMRNILARDWDHFVDRQPKLGTTLTSPKIRYMLFNLHGSEWLRVRKLTSSAFSSSKLRSMYPSMMTACQGLIQTANSSPNDLNLLKSLANFSISLVSDIILGVKVSPELYPEWQKERETIIDFTFLRYLEFVIALIFPFIGHTFGLYLIPERCAKVIIKVIEDSVALHKETDSKSTSVIQSLVDIIRKRSDPKMANKLNGKEFDNEMNQDNMDDIIISQVILFFFGIFEHAQYTLLELAQNPDMQATARGELQGLLERYGSLNYDAMQEATFLGNCLKESLRKYTPNPSLTRYCTKKYELSEGVTIDEGTRVIFSLLGSNCDPDVFPEPEKFNPYRFTDGSVRPNTFFPFGKGPRHCIGMRYAKLTHQIILAAYLLNFEVSVSPKTQFPLKVAVRNVINKPENPIYFNLKKLPGSVNRAFIQ